MRVYCKIFKYRNGHWTLVKDLNLPWKEKCMSGLNQITEQCW
jgi:hypothetical protein